MSATDNDSQGGYVLIMSADGYSFVVQRKIAMASSILRAMLDVDSAFQESSSKVCSLQYRGIIVQKVIEYLMYKVPYADFTATDIREDFAERIDPYIALELLTAADYLDT